jgi:hypothetical protein
MHIGINVVGGIIQDVYVNDDLDNVKRYILIHWTDDFDHETDDIRIFSKDGIEEWSYDEEENCSYLFKI